MYENNSNQKIKPNMKEKHKSKSNNNDLGLKELLEEADKITLDDLDFNKILKEQSSILCDIKKMIHYENNANNKEPFKCDIMNLKNDKKLQIMINKYKKNYKNNNNLNLKTNILNTKANLKKEIKLKNKNPYSYIKFSNKIGSSKKLKLLPKKPKLLYKKSKLSPKKSKLSPKKSSNKKHGNITKKYRSTSNKKLSIKKCKSNSVNNINNNSKYFDISGTIKIQKHK